MGLEYSPVTKLLYASEPEYADITNSNGGIEVVSLNGPTELTTLGIVIDDTELGGSTGPLRVNGDKGYVTSSAFDFVTETSITKVYAFNLDPAADHALTLVYSSDGFVPDLAIDENGKLLIADWSVSVNGIAFVDPNTGTVDGATIATGASPSSITFIEK
jgi:hypothetical protein